MPIKTSSAKAKGRRHQQWVRDKIYETFPVLEDGDVRSTSMGAGGEDLQLSPAARRLFPTLLNARLTSPSQSTQCWIRRQRTPLRVPSQ